VLAGLEFATNGFSAHIPRPEYAPEYRFDVYGFPERSWRAERNIWMRYFNSPKTGLLSRSLLVA